MEVSGQFYILAVLAPGKRASGTHWKGGGGWVGLTAGVDVKEKRKTLILCQEWNPDSLDIQP
jgi:hypothetical protein